MRGDDHAYINQKGKVINPHNQRESLLRKELEEKHLQIKQTSREGRLIINPITELSSEEDHNYLFYINNFNRVVKQHIDKISIYNKNHK